MPDSHEFSMLLFPGFSNLCLANAVEPLRAANTLARRRLYRWSYVAAGTETVPSSSGLPVQPEAVLADMRGDYLFVMPSYGLEAQDTQATARRLRAAADRFKVLVGLDTGSWLLARAGLMDGHRVTSHWDILSSLAETFPQLTVTEDRFVLDGARASCGGATTTLDLMLALIEHHHGPTLALEVAALFMYGERDPDLDPSLRVPANRTVRAAAALMRRNVERPLPIAAIASGVGLGQRGLEAMFRRHAGQSPQHLYRSIRLAEARRRLEHTRESVAEIASRCGYGDPSAMARAFRQEFGISPRQARSGA